MNSVDTKITNNQKSAPEFTPTRSIHLNELRKVTVKFKKKPSVRTGPTIKVDGARVVGVDFGDDAVQFLFRQLVVELAENLAQTARRDVAVSCKRVPNVSVLFSSILHQILHTESTDVSFL